MKKTYERELQRLNEAGCPEHLGKIDYAGLYNYLFEIKDVQNIHKLYWMLKEYGMENLLPRRPLPLL